MELGLSPDTSTVYVAETRPVEYGAFDTCRARRNWTGYQFDMPGKSLVATLPDYQLLDSLAVQGGW